MAKRTFLLVFLFVIAFFYLALPLHAQDDSSYPAITIINPIRGSGLGHETDDLLSSLKAQWQVTKEADVQATWLFQYGALENSGITEFAKSTMKDQEFGLLFEIDKQYAEHSRVQFRGKEAWYFSDGLLLSSYDRSERQRLIDAAFKKFKIVFGYYPKTVGAWWIGGDSLFYMQRKYSITGVLRAADQFNLDFYSIWGTPWNIPYLASKINEGIPASSFEESSKVVILQWAIRDPLKGYADATYSLQDYGMKGYTTNYVDYLASIYLQKPYGNFVMGLENGATLEIFQQSYKTMLTKAKEIQASGKVNIILAKDYAEKFLSQKKVFAGKTHFLSTDYDSSDQSFWYTSENYRVAVHKIDDSVSVVDIRNYSTKTKEDFDMLPNSQGHLRINAPEIIDTMRFPYDKLVLGTTKEPLSVKAANKEVELYAGKNKIAFFTPTSCTFYLEDNSEKYFSFPGGKWLISPIHVIISLYTLYFIVVFVYKKRVRSIFKEYGVLILPLFFGFSLFLNNSTFLFDKKESIILYLLSFLDFLPILTVLYMSKILPFIILFFLHFVSTVKLEGKYIRRAFWCYYAGIIFLYFHIPYFPLDTTTYALVAISFAIFTIVIFFIAYVVYRNMKSKRNGVLCLSSPCIILLLIAIGVIASRSRFAITSYEIRAMQNIKDQNKNVVYVEQLNNSIKPIYKAVKPMLYKNYLLGQLLTDKRWERTVRPENNILSISGYENKIIVIPRYIGSDISEYEIKLLELKKVFDNAHIALFEKI